MNISIDPEWLLRMAKKEDNQILSVGGLVSRIGMNTDAEPLPTKEVIDWSHKFPLHAMRKLNFSLPDGVTDIDTLLEFFGESSFELWRSKWESTAFALRQTSDFSTSWEPIAAWLREAEIIANDIRLAEFSEEILRSSLDALRRLTREPVDVALDKAQQICALSGVALVIVQELPSTRLYGCAHWLSETHALVGLTNRYKKDDQLWFTFFHEIGHILMHRGELPLIVDNASKYMGDDNIDKEMVHYEEEADQFASSTLIPATSLVEFLLSIDIPPTNDEIHAFADSIGVGPGIVVGRLQHDGILEWHQGNALKQTIELEFKSED